MSSRSSFLLATIAIWGAAWLPGLASAEETLTLQTIQSPGTNLTTSSAQIIDLSSATNQPLFNAALSAFNTLNSDTVLQNASSFSGGQQVSPEFFPYGGSSVGVNSQVQALGSLTATGTSGSTNYFAFDEPPGAFIHTYGTATSPPGQGAELLLYDNGGNLVAVADGNASDGLSSVIDFTVPSGGAGIWESEITQAGITAPPIDYKLLLTLPFSATSEFTTNVIGNGTEEGGSLGSYEVNVNAGDSLSFDVHSTSPASAQTELLLYDNNGNLVAVAEGNGPDALSSIIDFVVPSGGAGEWTVQVSPTSSAYAYDLAIQGASGLGPISPTPTSVPEPSTWALALAGFAGVGLIAWRRAGRETGPPRLHR